VFDVVVVGSANLDLVVRSSRIPGAGETLIGSSYHEYPGGKGLNQAVAASRSGALVAFVGALGDDDAGHRLRRDATVDHIDMSATPTIDSTPTGRALITVDTAGENTIVVVPGANESVDGRVVPDSSVVLAQLEIPLTTVIEAFRAAKARGATTILNPAPAAPLPDELLRLVDLVVPNEHEIELIGGIDALLAGGVRTVIVTKGAAGVEVTTAGLGARAGLDARGDVPTTTSYAAIEVEALDATGAGDAFCGALAARLAAGAPLDHAVRWAICAGGLATTRHGAVPSLPTSEEITARL
jgi:ribokinase